MNPAWLIDEYASIRLTSVCTTASTAPTSKVATANAYTYGCQSILLSVNATTKTRSIPAKAAAFTAEAMKATVGVGAPWYTSGTQAWNGTAATLKPNPTSNSASPARSSAGVPLASNFGSTVPATLPTGVANSAIRLRFVEPVDPYTSAIPYRKKADENAPSTKYFMPAS